MISREQYVKQLIDRQGNGMVKVITGIRRAGKSCLLFQLYYQHLLDSGVHEDHIIKIAFDMRKNEALRDPDAVLAYIETRIRDSGTYYILLDEVQMLRDFASVLNELLHIGNADVYVTGSNSRFLSSDILTEFRGRGDEVHVFPLSFREFLSVYDGTVERAWEEYYTYGGLPQICTMKTETQKSEYLRHLTDEVYLKDIVERNGIRHPAELSELLDVLASSIGSLTNGQRLVNTFKTVKHISVTANTIARYAEYLEQAFLLQKAIRFNIKGRKYIGTPCKYYFEDVGLRNARLNFRQTEENHIMENIIYNELRMRGYRVDVGVVETRERVNGVLTRKQREVDFVANLGSKRYYIQSAYNLPTDDKREQETRSLKGIDDSFKKIIVVRENILPKRDENGFLTLGIFDFLSNPQSLDI